MTDRDYMAKLLNDAINLGFGCQRPKRDGSGRLSPRWAPPAIPPTDIPEGPSGSPKALIAANLRSYEYYRKKGAV